MSRYRNVCFTLNYADGLIEFDEEKMDYLVYQEEVGAEGNYHFQGYCEFAYAMNLAPAKELLGGPTVHIERRRGTQAQAIAYCKDPEKRIAHTEPYEEGTPRVQGKRQDLEGFKDAVLSGKRKRDLMDDHFGIFAKFPKFYTTLTMMHRPRRSEELVVTLLIGDTGLGKTRFVYDAHGEDDEFYVTPLGEPWYDGYDGHKFVLFDDFAGKMSKVSLCDLLCLLDRYPQLVKTKGGFTWWLPNQVYLTTNILPTYWYDWGTKHKISQYWALARRIHKVRLYYVPLSGADSRSADLDSEAWFKENAPEETTSSFIGQ